MVFNPLEAVEWASVLAGKLAEQFYEQQLALLTNGCPI